MADSTPTVTLKPKREAPVQRRHPWIFSGSVAGVSGDLEPGTLVAVRSDRGAFLAWGHYNPYSKIRVRLVSWDEHVDPEAPSFWLERFETALAVRRDLVIDEATTCYRILHAESDGVPGLFVDRYGEVLVVQYLTAGSTARQTLFDALLWDLIEPTSLYDRSDVDILERERLAPHTGPVQGPPPAETLEVLENGLRFLVDVRGGHKSGFYLDQRENRAVLRRIVERLCRVQSPPSLLNVFAYTGGFGVYGLAGGASKVVNVDTSGQALALGRRNVALNGFDPEQTEDIVGDAFEVLRTFRDEGRRFDIIVLDPPKFAFTRRDIQSASRGYKDVNLQALHLLKPGGILMTFSCSGVVSAELFQKILFGAALDAGRSVQILRRLSQGPDHPVALTFPEGAYLKGLVLRAV
jgi:23S rRNA (cytosine1962-C5)-methyltransferase